ncbi:MAG: hypothetical protein ACI4F7_03700, partial [Acutalibacteraceae bacterium]
MRAIIKKVISVFACVAVFVGSVWVTTFSAFADTEYVGIIKNGGFEDGAWNDLVELDTTVAHNGNNSMKLTAAGAYSPEYNYCPGLVEGTHLDLKSKSYALTFWAK